MPQSQRTLECCCNREEANVNNDDIKATALLTGICSLTTDQHMQITLNLVDNNPKDEGYDLYTCYYVISMSYVIIVLLVLVFGLVWLHLVLGRSPTVLERSPTVL